jgi:predicted GNAT family acetyltransferase
MAAAAAAFGGMSWFRRQYICLPLTELAHGNISHCTQRHDRLRAPCRAHGIAPIQAVLSSNSRQGTFCTGQLVWLLPAQSDRSTGESAGSSAWPCQVVGPSQGLLSGMWLLRLLECASTEALEASTDEMFDFCASFAQFYSGSADPTFKRAVDQAVAACAASMAPERTLEQASEGALAGLLPFPAGSTATDAVPAAAPAAASSTPCAITDAGTQARAVTSHEASTFGDGCVSSPSTPVLEDTSPLTTPIAALWEPLRRIHRHSLWLVYSEGAKQPPTLLVVAVEDTAETVVRVALVRTLISPAARARRDVPAPTLPTAGAREQPSPHGKGTAAKGLRPAASAASVASALALGDVSMLGSSPATQAADQPTQATFNVPRDWLAEARPAERMPRGWWFGDEVALIASPVLQTCPHSSRPLSGSQSWSQSQPGGLCIIQDVRCVSTTLDRGGACSAGAAWTARGTTHPAGEYGAASNFVPHREMWYLLYVLERDAYVWSTEAQFASPADAHAALAHSDEEQAAADGSSSLTSRDRQFPDVASAAGGRRRKRIPRRVTHGRVRVTTGPHDGKEGVLLGMRGGWMSLRLEDGAEVSVRRSMLAMLQKPKASTQKVGLPQATRRKRGRPETDAEQAHTKKLAKKVADRRQRSLMARKAAARQRAKMRDEETQLRDEKQWREWTYSGATSSMSVRSCSWPRVDAFLTRMKRETGVVGSDGSAGTLGDSNEFNIDYILRQLKPMRDGPADSQVHVLLQLQAARHGDGHGQVPSALAPTEEVLGVVAAVAKMSRRVLSIEFRAIYVVPRLRGQALANALVHFAIEDVREQTRLGNARWSERAMDGLMAFVVLPHCMQTSARFWGQIGFELGAMVDRKEHKQATLSSIKNLKGAKRGSPGDISAWALLQH